MRRRCLGGLPGGLCACLLAGSLGLAFWPATARAASFRVLNLTERSQEQFALLSVSALGRMSALQEFKRKVVRVDAAGALTPLPPVPFGQVRSSSINDAGQAVYLVERLCNESEECKEVCNSLPEEYDVDPERCERDLMVLLQVLADRGLIKVKDATDA